MIKRDVEHFKHSPLLCFCVSVNVLLMTKYCEYFFSWSWNKETISEIDGDNLHGQHAYCIVVKYSEYGFHLLSLSYLPKSSNVQLKLTATAVRLIDLTPYSQLYFIFGPLGY